VHIDHSPSSLAPHAFLAAAEHIFPLKLWQRFLFRRPVLVRDLAEPKKSPAAGYAFRGGGVIFV
jgi:hypothetical protein